MSFITFNPILSSTVVFTASGNYTITNESVLIVNKGTGAATTVNLPQMTGSYLPVLIIVKDGKGDANTNNITVDGAGSETIDGATTSVISTAYGCRMFLWNGTQWNVLSTS